MDEYERERVWMDEIMDVDVKDINIIWRTYIARLVGGMAKVTASGSR